MAPSASRKPLQEATPNVNLSSSATPNNAIGKENAADGASKKRKLPKAVPEIDLHDIDVPDGTPIDQNCDQIRRKINRLLDNTDMKVGEFCNILGVSSNSLSRFRGQNGPMKGASSDAFQAAWEYFKKREIAGLKLPLKKKQKTSDDAKGGDALSVKSRKKDMPHPDISHIVLEDEEYDDVPVYETCDEVRRKIATYLKKPGVTQAQFCRDLHAQLHAEDKPTSIQSSQLHSFRSKKGPNAGAKSIVFYAAYVFFEKIRLAEGKPKSQFRLEMEDVHPGGFDREHDASTRYICSADANIGMDRYGKIRFS